MKKFIFSLGIIDKKLIIPLITTIIYIIYMFYFNKYPADVIDMLFYYFGVSIGEIITFYVPYIFNYKTTNNENKKCTKNNIIDYFFLILFYTLKKICLLFEFNFEDENMNFLFIMEGFEITIICLTTKIFLKYKYYIHHIISLIVFLILSIIMDLILENFVSLQFNFIIYLIILSIVEVIDYCYIKYMMDVKYHSLYNMIFFRGISEFFSTMIIFSVLLIIKFESNDDTFLKELSEYDKSKIGKLVIRIVLGIIGDGIINSIFEFNTLNLFNPNYIFVCYEISKITNFFFYIENLSQLFILIPFTFQIIALLFYIEIFEFNFCGLNKNTKKNILLREKEEIKNSVINRDSIVVELKDGYLITNKENENETERKNELLPEEKKD